MRPRSKFRVIREPKPAKPTKTKAAPCFIEHAVFGLGRLLAIRQIDGSDSDFVVDVKFGDGTRTILLLPHLWLCDIQNLIPQPPKYLPAPVKADVREKDGGEMQAVDMAA